MTKKISEERVGGTEAGETAPGGGAGNLDAPLRQAALFGLAGANAAALPRGGKAEQRKKIKDREKALFGNAPEVAWVKDRGGRFVTASGLFAEACGVSQRDLVGKTDWDIWPRELAARYTAHDKKVIDFGRPASISFSSPGPDGQARWVEIVNTPIVGEDGEVLGTLGISRDVSAYKRAASRLQRVSRQVILAREEEKKKISNMLHDEVGSLIMRINAALCLVEEELGEKPPGSALTRIREAKTTVGDLAAAIRGICYDIRPPSLAVLGLGGAVTELVRRLGLCTEAKLDCDAALLDEKKGEDLVKIIIYRIIQEALNNALKHAGAKTVKVRLGSSAGRLRFSVSDDGRGFDAEKVLAGKGKPTLGLRIMREEAGSVCAEVSVSSQPGFGAVVSGDFPLRGAHAD
jgi:PAS domain S-box-containing protein